MTARRAAEALFTPKPEPDPAPSIKAHKPRVLPVLPPTPIRQVSASATSEPATVPEIPAKKSSRLRTLVKYGMTVSQVAEVYQVPIETIERMLRKP